MRDNSGDGDIERKLETWVASQPAARGLLANLFRLWHQVTLAWAPELG